MIEINKKWAIGADSDNIILYRKSTPKKEGAKPTWLVKGYFSSLHNALNALADQEVKDTKLDSLKILNAKLDDIHALIKNLPRITVNDLRGK